eukprot:515474-Prymnesium_polylepis.1
MYGSTYRAPHQMVSADHKPITLHSSHDVDTNFSSARPDLRNAPAVPAALSMSAAPDCSRAARPASLGCGRAASRARATFRAARAC